MQIENIFLCNVSVLSTVILSEKMKILKQFKMKQLFTILASFGNFFELVPIGAFFHPITLSTIFDRRNNNLGQLFGQSYLLTRFSCFDSIFFH
jgi:hypothetical protein